MIALPENIERSTSAPQISVPQNDHNHNISVQINNFSLDVDFYLVT